MKTIAFALAALVAACVSPSDVVCGDGRVCPSGTTCDDTRGFCLSEAQTTACSGIDDGQPCDAAGTPGICDRSFCEPGCGDGVTDPDEQCDDGNFASHDGCSSACSVETPTWINVPPQWQGINYGLAAYDPAIGRTVFLDGVAHDGVSSRIWQRDPMDSGGPEHGWHEITDAFAPDERPPATLQGGLAYDGGRGVLVLYGGTTGTTLPTDTWEYVASANTFEGEPIGTWRKVVTPTNPGGRYLTALAYDAQLGAVVMFGGFDYDGTATNAVWTYDGTDWTPLTTTGTPPTLRIRHSVTYDATRQKLVVYGGGSNDSRVYELSGNAWTTITPSGPGPGPRRNAAVAYDATRGTVVLFGGQIGTTPDIGSDTWEWNGTAWARITGARNPPARRIAAAASEPTGPLIVGGGLIDESAPYADAWSLENGVWTDRTPRFEPAGLNDTAATYVPGLGVVALGGTASLFAASLREVWAFDGARWSRLPDAPRQRVGAGVAYDSDQRRLLALGGYCDTTFLDDCSPMSAMAQVALAMSVGSDPPAWTELSAPWDDATALADVTAVYDPTAHHTLALGGYRGDGGPPPSSLAVFDGSAWSSIAAAGPIPTGAPAAAWDPVSESVFELDLAGATWQLRDGAWTQVLAPSSAGPAGRELPGFAYEPLRKRFVLTGGITTSGILDDVWELDPAALTWTQLFVAGTSPLPRQNHNFVRLDEARAVVLRGGLNGSNQAQHDTWLLRFVSTTPDEQCGNGVDDDGDQQIDAADPDCT